jgi:hypothetical protein
MIENVSFIMKASKVYLKVIPKIKSYIVSFQLGAVTLYHHFQADLPAKFYNCII